MTNRRRLIAALAALALALPLPARAGDGVTVFAAASLKTALDQINSDWQAATGKKAVASYAGSSALAKQIEQEQLSVRRTEEIVREMLKAGTMALPTDADASAPAAEKP
ncbi:MAG TPA: substrate-binding domain-containing protein, partial [Aestuariivirga sp.]|nr:substrate-binding domain-containing protein [Aestuariivirga sp.]